MNRNEFMNRCRCLSGLREAGPYGMDPASPEPVTPPAESPAEPPKEPEAAPESDPGFAELPKEYYDALDNAAQVVQALADTHSREGDIETVVFKIQNILRQYEYVMGQLAAATGDAKLTQLAAAIQKAATLRT